MLMPTILCIANGAETIAHECWQHHFTKWNVDILLTATLYAMILLKMAFKTLGISEDLATVLMNLKLNKPIWKL